MFILFIKVISSNKILSYNEIGTYAVCYVSEKSNYGMYRIMVYLRTKKILWVLWGAPIRLGVIKSNKTRSLNVNMDI